MSEKTRDNPMHRLPDWRLTLPLAQSCPRCGARPVAAVSAGPQRCQTADAECTVEQAPGLVL
jgi:hypothetical protein